MIELPEAYVLAKQINETLIGKTISKATANASPHAFAAFTGDPALYDEKLRGKKITTAVQPNAGYNCYGSNVVMDCGEWILIISTPVKYHTPGAKLPPKHQLLLSFEDGSHVSCTVQMWGCMYLISPDEAKKLAESVESKPDPTTDAFDEKYFDGLWNSVKPNYSVKAFLATEQRIPGFGNGVLQDILWNAKLHPKKKLEAVSQNEKEKLFSCVKNILIEMRDKGGRDTERDLFNKKGGYETVLSAGALSKPCPVCGSAKVREAYLGGNIYFCPGCQGTIKK